MYQPRRVAGPIEPTAAVPSQTSPFERSSGPRRALPAASDHWHSRGSVALAVLTTAATAGAVILSNTGTTAIALAGPVADQRPALNCGSAAPMAKLVAESRHQLVGSAKKAVGHAQPDQAVHVGFFERAGQGRLRFELLGKVSQAAVVKATADIEERASQGRVRGRLRLGARRRHRASPDGSTASPSVPAPR